MLDYALNDSAAGIALRKCIEVDHESALLHEVNDAMDFAWSERLDWINKGRAGNEHM